MHMRFAPGFTRWLLSLALALGLSGILFAQDLPQPEQTPGRVMLPQTHQYQRQLRAYMATLTEQDFEPSHGALTESPLADADAAYHAWLLSLELPRVGGKTGAPSVILPASHFTLAALEGEKAVIRPYAWSEPNAWLANWHYPGNPYYGSRALKLRAFVVAALDMMMMDDILENSTQAWQKRLDWFGPHLLMYAYTYAGVKDALPADARGAYEAGLKKMIRRVIAAGPRGEETFMDMSNVAGMSLAAKALGDPEISRETAAYANRFFTEGQFFNSAGYFTDQGCFDPGYNGLTLYFATIAALGGDWPFAREAVAKAYRLRTYLCLPEPDGALLGPSHMSFRTGSDSAHGQWEWPYVFNAAALLTDDALCMTRQPTPEVMESALKRAVAMLNTAVKETPGNVPPEKLVSRPWKWALWPNAAMPSTNSAHDYYPAGRAARFADLVAKASPLLKYPFQREGDFTEVFGKSFVAAKRPSFGVVLHTGPVSDYPGGVFEEYPGPYGLGGGCLSAFWTPATGAVILGRRGGMAAVGGEIKTFDKPEEWRSWPVHAVIGAKADGRFFTSARIQQPETVYDIKPDDVRVTVRGAIPPSPVKGVTALDGTVQYARAFRITAQGLHVETTVKGDGKDTVAELYEALPLFLREAKAQAKSAPATIEFQAEGQWTAATAEYREQVTAIRLTRFTGAVLITFDTPQRVKLTPADWVDPFMSKATCRNLLIDLGSGALAGEKSVGYLITPVAQP